MTTQPYLNQAFVAAAETLINLSKFEVFLIITTLLFGFGFLNCCLWKKVFKHESRLRQLEFDHQKISAWSQGPQVDDMEAINRKVPSDSQIPTERG